MTPPPIDQHRQLSDNTIFFAALGCAKNRVDTERMVGLARRLGWSPVADPAEADLVVVNSCGFIGEAMQESVETAIDLARFKQGRCQTLVLAGCLSQRYPDELAHEMPEVDHFIGTADLERLSTILSGETAPRRGVGRPGDFAEERWERDLSLAGHSAYLKVAEGCDRQCAFCVIPSLRGPQRSRTVPSLVDEAAALAHAGARELNLVAQDLTAYGRDLDGRPGLHSLLRALDQVEGIRWIRLLYAYPTSLDDQVLRAVADLDAVVPYLDLPLQHIDDQVLRAMRRGYDGRRAQQIVDRAREVIPGVALRTTLICGHPGETDQAHADLLRWLEQTGLDHVGVFVYSPEEGTPAASMVDRPPREVAERRAQEVMQAQRAISRGKLRGRRGELLEVLVDGPSPESEYLLEGRHAGQAPEVDGVVVLSDAVGCSAGDLIQARVTDTADFDLAAKVIAPPA